MKNMKAVNGEMRSGGTDARVVDQSKPLPRDVIHRIEKQTQSDRQTHREHYPPVSPAKKK
jgi:hypothetical protein